MSIKITIPNSSSDVLTKVFLDSFDYVDGKLFWKKTAKHNLAGKEAGWKHNAGYTAVAVNYKKYLAHRVIFNMFHGYEPKEIDHIDGDKSNNKIENLRDANSSQNKCNTKIRSDNTSGVKNVCWNKQRNTWVVRIAFKGKIKQWYVDNLELAELIAIEAREKLHGVFANHGYKEKLT
jgi:hypothetical protein